MESLKFLRTIETVNVNRSWVILTYFSDCGTLYPLKGSSLEAIKSTAGIAECLALYSSSSIGGCEKVILSVLLRRVQHLTSSLHEMTAFVLHLPKGRNSKTFNTTPIMRIVLKVFLYT